MNEYKELFECIMALLKAGDVLVGVEDIDSYSCEDKICMSNQRKIAYVDFSLHNKPFEDKIAELENIINHKLGDWDKQGITYQEILDMKAENQELKQRIAELENENKNLNIRIFQNEAYGDKKPTKINLNDRIKVKLTPLGVKIYYHQYDELNEKIKENGGTQLEPRMPEIDKDGFTEFTLWHFMELYGEHIGMCKPNVIEPLNIVVAE